MFLLVTPAGGKLWRLKYRLEVCEKLLAIGTCPEIGLGEARRRRENARELIALGNGPSRGRQREKQREKLWAHIQAADTFKAICDEYCNQSRRDGAKRWPPATAVRCEYLLSLVCGSTGKRPIGEIEPTDVLSAIRRIEDKGKLESARRSIQLAGAVFRYAVATARLASDPTRDLRRASSFTWGQSSPPCEHDPSQLRQSRRPSSITIVPRICQPASTTPRTVPEIFDTPRKRRR